MRFERAARVGLLGLTLATGLSACGPTDVPTTTVKGIREQGSRTVCAANGPITVNGYLTYGKQGQITDIVFSNDVPGYLDVPNVSAPAKEGLICRRYKPDPTKPYDSLAIAAGAVTDQVRSSTHASATEPVKMYDLDEENYQ